MDGRGGDDLLKGSFDQDHMDGGDGNDTYLVGDNGGSNLIVNDQTGNGSDILRFTGAASHEQLWFKQEGNDLVIDVVGGDTVVTLDDWYSNTENQVDQIETSDGYVLTKNNIDQLVAAMARYEALALHAPATNKNQRLSSFARGRFLLCGSKAEVEKWAKGARNE